MLLVRMCYASCEHNAVQQRCARLWYNSCARLHIYAYLDVNNAVCSAVFRCLTSLAIALSLFIAASCDTSTTPI
jgi:hypothetical protein